MSRAAGAGCLCIYCGGISGLSILRSSRRITSSASDLSPASSIAPPTSALLRQMVRGEESSGSFRNGREPHPAGQVFPDTLLNEKSPAHRYPCIAVLLGSGLPQPDSSYA